ncbi:MAG: hypothetical protein SV186_00340 [Candidatus Nanohaloarchaea archaeon]|nr:hypothetical protein [Candidatus Nanohaloarchaea archaeon]
MNSDSDDPTLFLNHTHTATSNDFTEQYGSRDVNHHTDYIAITEQLPDDISIVYNRTEHDRTGTDLYDDIRAEVEARGGEYEQFERHAWFRLDGTEAAVINSVEASVEDEDWHYTINGLPIEDQDYHDLSEDGLYDAAQDAAWTAPAHPFIPEFQPPEDQLDRFFQQAQEDGFQAAINYSTGYSPLVNRLARGETSGLLTAVETVRGLLGGSDDTTDRDVHHYADQYDIPLVPELDSHAALPDRLEGSGVIDTDVMDDLRDGDIPGDDLLGSDVLSYSEPGDEGLSWPQFLTSFPDTAPLYDTGLLPLPDTEDEFSDAMERSLAGLDDIEPGELLENAYTPGEHR